MMEQIKSFRSMEKKPDRENSLGLVQRAIKKFSEDRDLMEKYLRQVWLSEEKIFKDKKHMPVMKKMITLYVAEHYLRGPKKDELIELVEGIVEEEIRGKGGYGMMKENYLWAFHKIYSEIASREEKPTVAKNKWKEGTPDWKQQAGGDDFRNN